MSALCSRGCSSTLGNCALPARHCTRNACSTPSGQARASSTRILRVSPGSAESSSHRETALMVASLRDRVSSPQRSHSYWGRSRCRCSRRRRGNGAAQRRHRQSAACRFAAARRFVAPARPLHRYRASLEDFGFPVGDRPALWTALSRRELSSQALRAPCGSGHAREGCDAVYGTGYAGVRGQARSHS
ncbi:hypothetical protein D3C76_596040 [compost metagenome]